MKRLFQTVLAFAMVAFAVTPLLAKVGRPNIWISPNGCQGLSVVVSDSLPDDQGLDDVELLFDSLGVIGPALSSYNVGFDGPEPMQSDYVNTMVTSFKIKVLDPLKPAYAALYAVNFLGDSTVREWHYTPPRLSLSQDTIGFINTIVGGDSSISITLTNDSNASVTIDNEEFPKTPEITSVTRQGQLGPHGSVTYKVNYHAGDTALHYDTIFVNIGCHRIPIPITSQGLAPIIYAEDLEFNGVDTGTTVCKTVRVWNLGNSMLTLSPSPLASPFSLENGQSWPDHISPGNYHTYDVCFTPTSYGTFAGVLSWFTNEPSEYAHGKSDSTHITGRAEVGTLHWDRTSDFYDPANGGADTLHFVITNTGKASVTFDSIAFRGLYPGDFIITNYIQRLKPEASGDSIPANIAFRPDLHFQAIFRSATAYIMSGGKRLDSLYLTGNTRPLGGVEEPTISYNFRLYPNPITGSTLHLDFPIEQTAAITISDMLGRIVTAMPHSISQQFEIPVSVLPNGNYLLQITSGGSVISRRFSILR